MLMRAHVFGQVSSEAQAAPIVAEGGPFTKKHRVSEPGVLVIEHTEQSDAGQCDVVEQRFVHRDEMEQHSESHMFHLPSYGY